jgi:hypothetical protein
LRLSEGDLSLPRKDFSIEAYIQRMAREQKLFLKSKTVYWRNGTDITSAVQEKLRELGGAVAAAAAPAQQAGK